MEVHNVCNYIIHITCEYIFFINDSHNNITGL